MQQKEEYKKINFIYSLAITLGTIVIGLISYILYSENIIVKPEVPKCEYNGWAYSDKQTFPSIDECNTCFCDDGEVVCTELDCTE